MILVGLNVEVSRIMGYQMAVWHFGLVVEYVRVHEAGFRHLRSNLGRLLEVIDFSVTLN